jgi:TolB protein
VEYGTSDSYGHESAHRSDMAPAKSSFLVSVPIAGLTAATTYHYRICAQDPQAGVAPGCSPDETFTTDAPGGRSGIAFFSSRGPGSPFTANDLVTMDANGANQTDITNTDTASEDSPSWSPDARKLAYAYIRYDNGTTQVGSIQIYVRDANGTNPQPLTTDSANHSDPAWSPDGERIAFRHTQTGHDGEIYVMDADGGNPVNLTTSAADEMEPAWSPDGRSIVYTRVVDTNSLADIWVMNADGTGKRPLTSTQSLNEGQPAWAPDGTRIAFTRNVGGSLVNDIFLMDADGANPVDVTNRAGHESGATWSPDGSTIAFEEGSEEIFSMTAQGGSITNLTNNPAGDFHPAWSPRP